MQSGQDATTTANDLRETAAYVEEVCLDALAGYTGMAYPLTGGNLADFQRPAPDDRSAQQGFEVLREDLERAAASLYALAAALESGGMVPPVMLLPIQPYVDAFKAARQPAAKSTKS